jgi:hypothetical protein
MALSHIPYTFYHQPNQLNKPNKPNQLNKLNKPNQLNKLNQLNQLILKRGSPLAERHFTGCIFGDMFFQFFTPQGLKCSATAVQRIHPGKVRMLAQQITKINLTGGYARIFRHFLTTL